MRDLFDLRDIHIQAYMDAIEEGCNVIYLVSDSLSTSKAKPLLEKYPSRLINTGIAEMNLIGMAAGLSCVGYIPATGNASAFLTARSNEQLKVDVSYSHSNVKINAMHPGFCYGQDGVTHHSTYDLATILGMPGIEVFYPCDARETYQVVRYGLKHEGPVFTAYGSGLFPNITEENYEFSPGVPIRFAEGGVVTIIALGVAIHDVLSASIDDADIFAVTSVRPLDTKVLVESISKTRKVVVVEHHQIHGGLGSIISEIISDNGIGAKLLRLGVPNNEFTPNVKASSIKTLLGLDPTGIAKAVGSFILS